MQLCPPLIPPSCPVLLSIVRRLSDAGKLPTPTLVLQLLRGNVLAFSSNVSAGRGGGRERQVTVSRTVRRVRSTVRVSHEPGDGREEVSRGGKARAREREGGEKGRKEGSQGRAANPTARAGAWNLCASVAQSAERKLITLPGPLRI